MSKTTTVYFLFTDTGTTLSRLINFFTKQSLNHVSISFDKNLTEVYSFGRKRPRNPFIGGFIREDTQGEFLQNSQCAILKFDLPKDEAQQVLNNIKKIETEQNLYRYNFIGLLGVLFQIEINREHAFFCSQFVSRMMSDIDSFQIDKPHCFVTPQDIRNHVGMELIYKGKLKNYSHLTHIKQNLEPKKSWRTVLMEKITQFVIR